MIFCEQCGTQLNKNAGFCSKCGSKTVENNNITKFIDGFPNFSVEGISFSYPSNYKVSYEKSAEGDFESLVITCGKKNEEEPDMIIITCGKNDPRSPENYIDDYKTAVKGQMVRYKFGPVYNSTFIGINCIAIDYKQSYMFQNAGNGVLYSFTRNGNLYGITKHSDIKENLFSEFQVLEQSLVI
ncbi:MAG: zinc ribbon domain-containing protein [Treponema sp.]|nr:zinc ribbon domain-containing protein [Treponema sp.]